MTFALPLLTDFITLTRTVVLPAFLDAVKPPDLAPTFLIG